MNVNYRRRAEQHRPSHIAEAIRNLYTQGHNALAIAGILKVDIDSVRQVLQVAQHRAAIAFWESAKSQ